MALKRLMGNQAANPKGIFGRFMGRMMTKSNMASNKWVVSLMDIKPNDHVLEIGFGPGTALRDILEITTNGHVAGIDISQLMIDQATQLNKEAVSEGRLDLRLGEAASMPWEASFFDKVLAINVIYLWPNLASVFTEIVRVLKPNGVAALYLAPVEMMDSLGFSELDAFTIHAQEDVLNACEKAGFSSTEVSSTTMGDGKGICIIARK